MSIKLLYFFLISDDHHDDDSVCEPPQEPQLPELGSGDTDDPPGMKGIDMPATSELIASNRSDEEVAKEINADWLIYQTLEDLIETATVGNPEIKEFESSIFTGKYITPLIENYLEELENSRKDELKIQREKSKASG